MTIKGKTLYQIAKDNGLSYTAVYQRLRAGWPHEKLGDPPQSIDQSIRKAAAARVENLNQTFLERFWKKVNKSGLNGCWLWMGSVNGDGYGQVKREGVAVGVHRLAFEQAFGNSPGQLQVCHRCDIPNCVNPDHLFLGTALDNVLDCMKKGRRRYRHGDTHHNSKLTDKDIAHIKKLLGKKCSTEFCKEVAAKYGVHFGHLRNIQYGFRRSKA